MRTGGTGFNRGIFDIFREDLTVVMPNGMTAERENRYVEVCYYKDTVLLFSSNFFAVVP